MFTLAGFVLSFTTIVVFPWPFAPWLVLVVCVVVVSTVVIVPEFELALLTGTTTASENIAELSGRYVITEVLVENPNVGSIDIN